MTHKHRFFDELPLVHRKAGKVLMAVQTGTCLYRGSREDGSPVEDEAFTSYLSSKVASSIPLDAIDILIESGRAGIRRFFADLREDPSLVDANGPLSYLLQCDAEGLLRPSWLPQHARTQAAQVVVRLRSSGSRVTAQVAVW